MEQVNVDLSIRLFGSFEILRSGQPIPDDAWPRRRTKALLKCLLVGYGHTKTEDQLIDALYGGEDPTKKVSNLRGRVSELRRALEPGLKAGSASQFILRSGEGYRFNDQSSCWIDTVEFAHHLQMAQKAMDEGQWGEAVDAYRAGTDLYRGDLLEEDAYEEWTLEPREQLRAQCLNAIDQLAECHAKLGDYDKAVACCRRVLRADPAREITIRKLMLFTYFSGEYGRALQVYTEGETALRENLDVEPSVETRKLREQIAARSLTKPETTIDPRRVAVLPFLHISPDPSNEYFADGMTDELIATLSRLGGLRVIAQTSIMRYKGTHKTAAQIGRELGVGLLVEGSVRKDNSSLRITAQVVQTRNDEHLWSESYDREPKDVFAVQKDIARTVCQAYEERLLADSGEPEVRAHSADPEAYSSYLRGRFYLGREAYVEAIECFNRAVHKDAAYALAYSGIADSYISMTTEGLIPRSEGFPKAQEAAETALSLDDTLSEAHCSLALVQWHHLRDPVAADCSFQEAIRFNPNNVTAHVEYSNFLHNWDRVEQALFHGRRAVELDPFSGQGNLQAGWTALTVGNVDETVMWFEKAVRVAPESLQARLACAAAKQFAGDWEGAGEVLLHAIDQFPGHYRPHMEYGVHLMCLGHVDEALAKARYGLSLLPGSVESRGIMADLLITARQYEEAIELCDEILAEDPSYTQGNLFRAVAYIRTDRYAEASQALDRADADMPRSSYVWMWTDAFRGVIYAKTGKKEQALRIVSELRKRPMFQSESLAAAAWVLQELGELNAALDLLEKSVERTSWRLRFLKVSPLYDAVRETPRFAALLKRMGFPE